jgi:putative FmdB family regulatory protein
MPTYEYECSRGHLFEVVQRISDAPLTRCKLCRAKTHRLISAANFILKGGGWYADGYSSSSSSGSKKAPSESSDSAKPESKSTESASSSPSD